MARLVITPSTFVNNTLTDLTGTLTAATTEGWYMDVSDFHDVVLIGYTTHTSAFPVTISAATSGTDYIYKEKGALSTSLGSSCFAILFCDSARFKTTSGLYISSTGTNSSKIGWVAMYNKPTL